MLQQLSLQELLNRIPINEHTKPILYDYFENIIRIKVEKIINHIKYEGRSLLLNVTSNAYLIDFPLDELGLNRNYRILENDADAGILSIKIRYDEFYICKFKIFDGFIETLYLKYTTDDITKLLNYLIGNKMVFTF